MAIRWVFFDIGGPILDETILQEYWGRTFREAAEEQGIPCSLETYRRLTEEGIRAFAGSVTEYIAWKLAAEDLGLHRRIQKGFWDRMRALSEGRYRELNPLQEGVAGAIEEISAAYRLGIVANQPARVADLLREYEVWDRFEVQGISEVVGLYKPDVRLYEHTLREAGARPEESVMVGDRIDNDIVPARAIGMWTVHFRIGRHAGQQPRGCKEIPHRTITSMAELPDAVRSLPDGEEL